MVSLGKTGEKNGSFLLAYTHGFLYSGIMYSSTVVNNCLSKNHVWIK